MKKELEDKILDIKKVKYLSGMALDLLMKYDQEEIAKHYDEIVTVFCYLDEQFEEKLNNLTKLYYDN